MTGVGRGSRVTFTEWRDGRTGVVGAGVEAGTVLDRGPGSGEWWVSVAGAAGAMLVHARHMTDSNAMQGRA